MFLAVILAIILFAGLVCVRYLADEAGRKKFYGMVATVDFAIILAATAGFIFRQIIPPTVVTVFGNAATIILMSQLVCGVLVIAAVIFRAIYRHFHKPVIFSRTRRKAILKGALFYPVASLSTVLYANQYERENTVDRFFDIKKKNLPPELEGLKTAQISDIHLGAYFSLERLENLLNRIVAEKPDLLAITGDIFDNEEMNPAAVKIVDAYTDKFKYGIYYCHGNHEYHRGIAAIEKYLSETNIKWLVNRAEKVVGNLYIIGADYPRSAPVIKSGEDSERDELFKLQKKECIDKALENVPEDAVIILLAHHPEFIDDGAERNFLLTLTGHTHGCQFGIFGLPLFPIFKYTRGIVENGESVGYVHCGNGSWFPFRIGCPPEVAYFTLKNSD